MEIPIESKRLKLIREELGMTQSSMAELINMGNTTADVERGRTRMSGKAVMKLLQEYNINPLWLYGESTQKYLNPNDKDVSPKMISLDNAGNENILMVNVKAAAGYAGNIGDPEYYRNLPAFTIPLPEYRNASYRGFQVEGLSMYPVMQPHEWIITKAISNVNEIKSGQIYVVIEQDSVRVKKVINDPKTHSLNLISMNPDYPNATVNYADVKELWEFHSKITSHIEASSQERRLDEIREELKEIKEALRLNLER
ncbi:MAG TPA: LexA family transcriptional regulator [Saprospiraceae bacterium]|nr:LexA family transcriptional regulator [Saprospiraceae bacterium]MCB9328864.1 LexA family transcriptional regulator [Lewinellaceae bacterium]HPK09163.1 LexA family transcriptional regulator [Saprospiraceae bacterium]HPQ20775.1 LexA family transcriptional regulator [Saprospiraceae bacterium]